MCTDVLILNKCKLGGTGGVVGTNRAGIVDIRSMEAYCARALMAA